MSDNIYSIKSRFRALTMAIISLKSTKTKTINLGKSFISNQTKGQLVNNNPSVLKFNVSDETDIINHLIMHNPYTDNKGKSKSDPERKKLLSIAIIYMINSIKSLLNGKSFDKICEIETNGDRSILDRIAFMIKLVWYPYTGKTCDVGEDAAEFTTLLRNVFSTQNIDYIGMTKVPDRDIDAMKGTYCENSDYLSGRAVSIINTSNDKDYDYYMIRFGSTMSIYDDSIDDINLINAQKKDNTITPITFSNVNLTNLIYETDIMPNKISEIGEFLSNVDNLAKEVHGGYTRHIILFAILIAITALLVLIYITVLALNAYCDINKCKSCENALMI